MQRALDEYKLSENPLLEQFSLKPLNNDSLFVQNGSTLICAGVGSGKSSLIFKLCSMYFDELNPDIFMFYAGTSVDETFSHNVSEMQIEVTYIPEEVMEAFVYKYRTLKQEVYECYTYLMSNSYWSETLQNIKKRENLKTLLNYAEKLVDIYTKPSSLKIGTREFKIKAIINPENEEKPFLSSLLIFDDIAQFHFSSRVANSFIKELTSNLRHAMISCIYSCQRYTYLSKDCRSQMHVLALGFGISDEDLTEISKLVKVSGLGRKELIEIYNKEIVKFKFLIINKPSDDYDIIKINR